MKEYSILVNRDDFKVIINEERNNFIKQTLTHIGLDVDNIWPENELTVEQKIELRNYLEKYNVLILDNKETFEIYVDKEKIATWHKPFYQMRIDTSEIDPSKKIFLEVFLKFESLFEDELDQEGSDNMNDVED